MFKSVEHDRERITMLQTRTLAFIVGLVFLGVYSVVMMATSGSAAWAWLVLAAAILMFVASARAERTVKSEQRDG
jgi:ABC-type bacteriocin/lantibiotic exporter with double-glycine peptidase domain